jgi:hypothetical protein
MNDENLRRGKHFSGEYQPAKRGRLPSALKRFAKENSVSKTDLDMIFKNVIFCKTMAELQEMVSPENKADLPVIVVAAVSAVLNDMKHGTLLSTNTVLDRIFGKAAQSSDVKVSGIQFLRVTATDEAALE